MGIMQRGRMLVPLQVLVATIWVGSTVGALGGTLTIDDKVGVLTNGRSQLEAAAARAPFDVRIFARDNTATKTDLDSLVDKSIRTGVSNVVAVGVDTRLRYLHIAANNARLNAEDVDSAQRAAGSQFKSGDWTGGMVAAIDQMSAAAQGTPFSAGRNVERPVAESSTVPAARQEAPKREGGGFPWGWILLLIGGFFVLRMFMGRGRRRREAEGYGRQGDYSGRPSSPPPGGYPPGAGPGYEQGGNRPGMGGGAMGGGLLGGLGGGVLGYLLGRKSGQSDRTDNPPDSSGGGGGAGSGGVVGGGGTDGGGFISGNRDSGDFGGGDDGGNDSGNF